VCLTRWRYHGNAWLLHLHGDMYACSALILHRVASRSVSRDGDKGVVVRTQGTLYDCHRIVLVSVRAVRGNWSRDGKVVVRCREMRNNGDGEEERRRGFFMVVLAHGEYWQGVRADYDEVGARLARKNIPQRTVRDLVWTSRVVDLCVVAVAIPGESSSVTTSLDYTGSLKWETVSKL
jgi:hypothetical protein